MALQLAAAKEAVERLTASAREPEGEFLQQDLDQLAEATEELAQLIDSLQETPSPKRTGATEVARQQRRYQELFDLAPDGYLVADAEGVILDANRAAADMIGLSREALRATSLVDYLADKDRKTFRPRVRDLESTGQVAEWETVLQPHEGTPYPVLVRVTASLSEPDSVLRILLYDLTSRRRAEQQEKAELKEDVDKARELERTKSNFLRLASHELRAPLAVVRGYLSMLGEGALGTLPPPARRIMPILYARVDEIGRMVEDMLEAARLEDGRLRLLDEELDLGSICKSAAERMKPFAGKTHRIVVRARRGVFVRADARRVSTILTNLMSNAIKYQPGGGRIEVTVSRDGRATVEVADHGLGISADQMNNLFKPFGRITTPKTSHIAGTGLGLYLSRELARLQGGDLELDSTEGEGTRARLHLPLAPRKT